jgi:hypothetical protein
MITIGRVTVNRIPDYFMERYDEEIAAWAQNFAKIGAVKSVVLKEGYFADLSPNEEQGAVLRQVRLIARMSRKGVEIEPLTKEDERLIANHCQKMKRAGVHPRMVLAEPERPWLPFMPTIGKPNE